MALTIISLKLSAEAVCGVTLEPYLQVRKGASTTVSGEDVPEEGASDARYVLRYRWYRSVHRGGQICWVRQSAKQMRCQSCKLNNLHLLKKHNADRCIQIEKPQYSVSFV